MKRSYIKRKSKPLSKIRLSARGEECTVRLPYICNFNPDTTVLAHSNKQEHGKGMGLKADDEFAAYCCSSCHDVIDGRAPRPDGMSYEVMLGYFEAGIKRTREILRRKGLIS